MSFMAISEFLYTHFVKALKEKIGYKCWELKFILINANIFLKFARVLVSFSKSPIRLIFT